MNVSQAEFHTALLAPSDPAPNGLIDGHNRPAGRRFSIYRNNVAVSLTEALETGFPVVAKLVGPRNFRKLCSVFLRRHPPDTPLMSRYGAGMPAFLAGFEPLAHIRYLPDVARLEQALRVSYHAADSTPLAADMLQGLTPDDLAQARVTLAPAVQLVHSNWPIHAIWAYNMEDDASKPVPQAQSVLVLRPGFDPEMHPLDAGGAACMAALIDGAPLAQASEAGLDAAPGFDLGALLALLMSGQAITDLAFGEAS